MKRLDETAGGEQSPEGAAAEKTTVGNYFISNYPPYSFWNEEALGSVSRCM